MTSRGERFRKSLSRIALWAIPYAEKEEDKIHLETIQEALEKQIPMEETEPLFCPKCGGFIAVYEYCPYCGQACEMKKTNKRGRIDGESQGRIEPVKEH